MSTGRTIEPVAAVFALGIREPLTLFTFWAHTVHFTIGDVVLEKQAAFRTDLGITTMVWRLAARGRTDIYGVTGITPVLAASHFFTNGALFHKDTSINSISTIEKSEGIANRTASFPNNIIISRQNFQSVIEVTHPVATGNLASKMLNKKAGTKRPGFSILL